MVSDKLLEIKEYTDIGYSPLVDYNDWRVAILNYIEELEPENINKFSKHTKTDEVFVLLKGEFILFIGTGEDKLEKIHFQKLEPLKLYNVKKGVWHTHTLSKDAMVLIIENRDTCDMNSVDYFISEEENKEIIKIAKENLGKEVNKIEI